MARGGVTPDARNRRPLGVVLPTVTWKGVRVSVLVIADIPGGTAEQDAALVKGMGLSENPPSGASWRAAGPTSTGWRIVSLWDSQEDFDRFRTDRLTPTLQAQNRDVPTVEIWPVETLLNYR